MTVPGCECYYAAHFRVDASLNQQGMCPPLFSMLLVFSFVDALCLIYVSLYDCHVAKNSQSTSSHCVTDATCCELVDLLLSVCGTIVRKSVNQALNFSHIYHCDPFGLVLLSLSNLNVLSPESNRTLSTKKHSCVTAISLL